MERERWNQLYMCCFLVEAFILATVVFIKTSETVLFSGVVGGCSALAYAVYVKKKNRRVKSKPVEVDDERTINIAQRSARYAFIIVAPQATWVGLCVYYLDKGTEWEYAGIASFFVGTMMLMIYFISYLAINRGMQRDG